MIRFGLAGVPVSVRPSFWLVALLLGLGVPNRALLVAWVVIVFTSVLLHELGHALIARRYGADVSITLTTFGGYTRWSVSGEEMTPGRRALVAAAGSGVGIVIGLLALGVFYVTGPWSPMAEAVLRMFVWVNVGWGVLNWLPIRPLDGGHVLLAFLDIVAPKRGDRVATAVFVLTGLAALAAAVYFDLIFAALLAGFMTWSEVTRLFPPPQRGIPLEFSYDDLPEEPAETGVREPGEPEASEAPDHLD